MTRSRLYLFDTTLRDGAQTQGVDFSVDDKRRIAIVLDQLGIDYVEGGYPGANATDTAFFADLPRLEGARFTAFGMTKRAGRSTANDPGFQAILQSSAPAICLVAKAWDYHVRVALGITNEENLEGLIESVKAVRASAANRESMIDCEHFFDGYKANRDYALAVAKAAYTSGARWVVLCDTNGGTLPHEIDDIVSDVAQTVPGSHLGIHTHNDTENAVANTLAAVRAGVRQIQGTLNGLGERCYHPHAVAEIGVCRPVRDRGNAGSARHHFARKPHPRRDPQSRAGAPGTLRRGKRVCHQSWHSCVGDPEGAGDLRARAP
jgi:2-isopropylmalate synthase